MLRFLRFLRNHNRRLLTHPQKEKINSNTDSRQGQEMSWINEIPSGEEDLPAIFQALSLSPGALEKVKHLNETLAFGGSALSRVQEEAIATVVAAANRCRYGALTHGGFLRLHSGDDQLASALLADYSQSGLTAEDQAMLEFAVKLTLEPAAVHRDDVEGLRDAGFNDEEILSIVLITGLVNFMNRLAQGLGVDVPQAYLRAYRSG